MTAGQRLPGKVALITGGASGIGRALGAELARHGAFVVLADRQIELAREAAAEIRSAGGDAEAVELDVRDLSSWAAAVDPLERERGGIDFLFNNAGIGVGGAVEDLEPQDWDDVVDVNLRGVAYGIQTVYPRMVRRGEGHIVNTASVLGFLIMPHNSVYVATKHAVLGLSKTLRVEGAARRVRVSVICPGAVRTPILKGGVFGRMRGNIPEAMVDRLWDASRPVTPERFARRVVPRVLANEAIIVEPRWWRLFWLLERLSPALVMHLALRNQRKFDAAVERFRARERGAR